MRSLNINRPKLNAKSQTNKKFLLVMPHLAVKHFNIIFDKLVTLFNNNIVFM